MKKIVLFLSMAFFVISCATTEIGRTFDATKAKQIEIGKTTEAEVIGELGQPIRIKTKSDGEKAFLYFHGIGKAYFGSLETKSQQFAILFDKNGIVKAIDKSGID